MKRSKFALPNETMPSNNGEILLLTVIFGVAVVAIVYLCSSMVHELFTTFTLINL